MSFLPPPSPPPRAPPRLSARPAAASPKPSSRKPRARRHTLLREALRLACRQPSLSRALRAARLVARGAVEGALFFLALSPAAPRVLAARARRARRVPLEDGAVLDVYAPEAEGDGGRPVVLFVHGGAWGSRSAAELAPLGTGLANLANCNVLLLDYCSVLYPHGLMEDQVRVVTNALQYVRRTYPDQKIVCVGHSSGAHIASLAFLRAPSAARPLADLFFAQGGVYDIANHLLYEANRGVAWISPMLPAACGGGGVPDVDAMDKLSTTQQVLSVDLSTKPVVSESLVLEGDAAGLSLSSLLKGQPSSTPHDDNDDNDDHDGHQNPTQQLSFPVVVVQAAVADLVVSTTSQSIPFFHALIQRGMIGGRLLLYEGQMGHEDFVVDWLRGERPVAREVRREILDTDDCGADARAYVAKHVYGETSAAFPDVSPEAGDLGPSAHIRDLVRVLLDMR